MKGQPHMKIKQDLGQMRALLGEFSERFLEHQRTIHEQPVVPVNLDELIEAFKGQQLSAEGYGMEQMHERLKAEVMPGLSNTAGPRAFPWLVGGVTPAAFIGALYQLMFDQINMVRGASIGPDLEAESINMLLELFDLPVDEFTGVFTTGATASNLSGLASARQWCGHNCGVDVANDGLSGSKPIKVFAGSIHSSITKAQSVLGFGRNALKLVGTMKDREAIDLVALEKALSAAGDGVEKIVVASAGTVNSADFDNIVAVAALCETYKAWLHVDAAFGLFARCSPEYAHQARGIELADSVTCDGHKWLNVPYDCGFFFIRKKNERCLTETFNASAAYLSGSAAEPMNRGVENSRALRLPVWATLTAYGREGYRELVERNCAFAKKVAEFVEKDEELELLTPTKLNVVLFRSKSITDTSDNAKLVAAINGTGKLFLTPTVYKGEPALRVAVCNWQTTEDEDLALTIVGLKEGMATYLLKKKEIEARMRPMLLSSLAQPSSEVVVEHTPHGPQ